MEKTCTSCHQSKPLDAFYRHARALFGRASRCKDCSRAYERSAEGKAARHRYETSAKGRAKGARYRGTGKARAAQSAWKRTEMGRASRLRDRQSEWNKKAQKKYKASHPEVYAAIAKRHLATERGRARIARYRESGVRLEIQRRYKRSAKGKLNSAKDQSIRRARRNEAGGSYTVAEWLSLCEAYGNACLGCEASGPLEPDHVVPIARGGSSHISNIQPLCRRCNQRKGTKSTDYRQMSVA